MFNNNSKKSKSGKTPNMPAINIISEGTTIEGSLESENDIRIAGIIEGHVQTKGKFMLTANGHVKGDIEAESADISGLVDGELHIKKQLVLRKSSIIRGDLSTKSLLVEQGAQFDGVCKMNGADANLKKEVTTDPSNNGQLNKEKAAETESISENQ